MFEEALDKLLQDYHSLLDRMKKGEQMIDALPVKSGEVYDSYVSQYNYLKILTMRANVSIDILNGDVVLIAEQGGNLVAARRVDDRAKKIIEEAERLGGFVTKLDIVERKPYPNAPIG